MFITDPSYGHQTPVAVVENFDVFRKLEKNRDHWMEVISRKEMQLETKQKHLKQQLEKEYKVEKKRNENY